MLMTGTFRIRQASLQDADAIAEIYAHYVLNSSATCETTPPDTAESQRRMTEYMRGGYPFLVSYEEAADGSQRIVAFGFASRYGPRSGYQYSVQTTIYVRHDSVGQGIGSGLLAELLNQCEARGYRQAFAVIAASEPASVVLHARAGFFPVGTLASAAWKNGQWLDIFLMQRKLGEGGDSQPEAIAAA